LKKKSDLMWSISLIAIGIATIILAGANIVGIDLLDIFDRWYDLLWMQKKLQ